MASCAGAALGMASFLPGFTEMEPLPPMAAAFCLWDHQVRKSSSVRIT